MISNFIERAKNGKSVYIFEVRDAFSSAETTVECVIETATDEVNKWCIPIPKTNNPHEKEFIKNYFYANIYNIISTYGGKYMTLNINKDYSYIRELCSALNDVFQINSKRSDRYGYGKCMNVTDRINDAFGYPPFRFIQPGKTTKTVPMSLNKTEKTDEASTCLTKAVENASSMVLIGLDIGGTDIKAVGTVNGQIAALMEYDWNPAGMTEIKQMTDAISFVMKELLAKMNADSLPDGVGVGFPDVIIKNKIVGGETLKTRGIRKASPDYETEFKSLLNMTDLLGSYCKPNAIIQMTNDGSLAAFTAAVELAHSNRADEIKQGVFAHTLGTELGTGWIDENCEIPQIPLEIYNCIIDLGNYPAHTFKPFDLRSTLNFNTEIAGTMQKYASQSGAYRLALEYFKKEASEQYNELFEKGFIEEKENGIYVITSPEDKRKPLLEHIMKLADAGQPQAENIFREIGKYLAATYCETEFLINPKTKKRILYGRFVKSRKCLHLLQEGAKELRERMEAGNENLAFTPLMKALKEKPDVTVAQFGQAIGAVYFVANYCKKRKNIV